MSILEPKPAPRYVPIGVAAEYASVSPRTLQRKIRSRELRAYHLGKRLLLELSDVDRLVKAGAVA